jgi:site-specific recombinase XerD
LTGPGHWSLGSTLGGSTVDVPLSTSTALATRDELFSADEQLALTGFLAGYSGLTRDAYSLDLRQYVAWCTEHRVAVFGARRADIECFARHLESLGRARATIARRLCTVACFYRHAEKEGLIAVSPAAHVRRPRLDYESHATHTIRRAFITAALDAGVPLRDVQEAAGHSDPRTTMRYDRARVSLDRHATYIVATFLAGASR